MVMGSFRWFGFDGGTRNRPADGLGPGGSVVVVVRRELLRRRWVGFLRDPCGPGECRHAPRQRLGHQLVNQAGHRHALGLRQVIEARNHFAPERRGIPLGSIRAMFCFDWMEFSRSGEGRTSYLMAKGSLSKSYNAHRRAISAELLPTPHEEP